MPELPLAHYEFSAKDDKRLGQARQRLQRQCMRTLGFRDFPLDPGPWRGVRMASTFTSTLTYVSPYGLLDLDRARRWGYGIDPDQAKALEAELRPKGRELTRREYEALYGPDTGAGAGGSSVVNGRKVPKDGCAGEARRRTAEGVADEGRLWSYVPERAAKIDKAVAEDERVRGAFGDWSRCVEDKGFKRYKNPARAFSDKAWQKGREGGNTSRTKEELGTAVADVECNRELNTAGVWWAVTNEKQREDLRRNKSSYEAVRKDQGRVRAVVRETLGRSGTA
ncbi:hypothetical protein AB0N81_16505 [Streptomyces sp. NPDC093510]|uniref:hypothetical protein n=1 Tax=Streptomyces sp. NPDC093510 TaxID=3155199 RepID=UPI00341D75C0